MKDLSFKKKWRSVLISGIIISIGLLLLKYIPMKIFGGEILFDASMHVSVSIFILYFFWYFIDQNKNWRLPYLVFSFVVLAIISLQRILVNAHNDFGLLLGFLIGAFGIIISRKNYFWNKFKF